ncbi:unnamed protein product, partial [Allacma fusca]
FFEQVTNDPQDIEEIIPKEIILQLRLNCQSTWTKFGMFVLKSQFDSTPVPILGVLIFGDRNVNAEIANKLGFGEVFEILDVTAESLETTIAKMLSTNKNQDRSKELLTVYRDRSQDSVDEAVHWTEYVMRYKG